jgi:hypothetical protein
MGIGVSVHPVGGPGGFPDVGDPEMDVTEPPMWPTHAFFVAAGIVPHTSGVLAREVGGPNPIGGRFRVDRYSSQGTGRIHVVLVQIGPVRGGLGRVTVEVDSIIGFEMGREFYLTFHRADPS